MAKSKKQPSILRFFLRVLVRMCEICVALLVAKSCMAIKPVGSNAVFILIAALVLAIVIEQGMRELESKKIIVYSNHPSEHRAVILPKIAIILAWLTAPGEREASMDHIALNYASEAMEKGTEAANAWLREELLFAIWPCTMCRVCSLVDKLSAAMNSVL